MKEVKRKKQSDNKRKEKYGSEKKNSGSEKKRKNVCEIFAKTCQMEAKRIQFSFEAEKNLKWNWRTLGMAGTWARTSIIYSFSAIEVHGFKGIIPLEWIWNGRVK